MKQLFFTGNMNILCQNPVQHLWHSSCLLVVPIVYEQKNDFENTNNIYDEYL